MAKDFDISKISGLSEPEAAKRLKEEGFNELPSSRHRNILAIAFEVAIEPMFLLLVACGTIYLILGDIREALLLLGFVFIIMGITFYQERKTERALEALRDLSSPRASVIRESKQKRIAGREVARGDIIMLSEGDRIPADAALIWSSNLCADESLLTGESASVRKTTWDGQMEMTRPGGENLPFIYSGTLIVDGQGVAEVRHTGTNTEMGKIGKALQTVKTEKTILQTETARVVRNVAIFGLSLCVIVVIVYGLKRGNWINGLLAGLTLAMATLPEEFPVVLTIFLALGAWRISQKNVLTRRIPTVETLGAATVLCVDKTGTLTLNKMSVRRLFSKGTFHDVNELKEKSLPESFHEIIEFGILASQKDPFDPMEKAFKELGNHYLANTEHLHADWSLVRQYPLSPELLAMSYVWQSPNGIDYVIASKGAPEAIADLCHFSKTEIDELSNRISTMANEGLRVLGVAKSYFRPPELPGQQHDFKFTFIGLVGLADPIRPTVPDALKECYSAGIRVVMITGDYPGTAQNIAKQIGLKPADDVITGAELDIMDDAELQRRVKTVNIFARVVPEQKLQLVNAFKANGEIVAMTGDGVNDAPALKAAHIGIAMGGRGTDVARESAALVLVDDDFSSIVQAIKVGRRIFDNLKKAMAYILAIHVPIAGMSLIPVVLDLPLALLAVHIVFLELIIDPACSIVFEAEPEEADVMNRPPRDPRTPLFSAGTVGISILQGICVLLIVLVVYGTALHWGYGGLEARVLTFTTLVIANLALIFTNRSWSRSIWATLKTPNTALWLVLSGALVFLGIVLYVPFMRNLFHFSKLHLNDIVICLSAGIISIVWFELLKIFRLGPKNSSARKNHTLK